MHRHGSEKMVRRIVLIRLSDEFSHRQGRAEVLEHSRRVLSSIPEVVTVSAGAQVAPIAPKRWDLALTLDFDSLEDAEKYERNAVHRAYLEDFLQPRLALIKAWNFEI